MSVVFFFLLVIEVLAFLKHYNNHQQQSIRRRKALNLFYMFLLNLINYDSSLVIIIADKNKIYWKIFFLKNHTKSIKMIIFFNNKHKHVMLNGFYTVIKRGKKIRKNLLENLIDNTVENLVKTTFLGFLG